MNDRIALDDLTSDALDQLYARLATAEREADEAVAAAAHLARLVGKRSEKAEREAKRQQLRADLAETELRTLRTGLRANGADPTQIQNLWAQIHLRNRQWREEKQRAERAEAERDRYRTCWHSARDRAQAHRDGTLRHVADRDTWMGWAKKAEKAVQYWYDAAVERLERAKQAEAARERVRRELTALERDAERLDAADKSFRDGYVDAVTRIRAALDEQQEQR